MKKLVTLFATSVIIIVTVLGTLAWLDQQEKAVLGDPDMAEPDAMERLAAEPSREELCAMFGPLTFNPDTEMCAPLVGYCPVCLYNRSELRRVHDGDGAKAHICICENCTVAHTNCIRTGNLLAGD
jgi:hypothetical protein